jgi:phage virion morphogenesis protein
MSIKLTFDKQEFEQQITKIRKNWEFDAKFYKDVANVILQDTKKRIKTTKVDPEGVAWKPWAEGTRKAREKKGTAALGLLFDSGALHNSFNYVIKKNGFELVSKSPYMAYLHNGTDHMPARKILGISKEAIADIKKIIELKFGR